MGCGKRRFCVLVTFSLCSSQVFYFVVSGIKLFFVKSLQELCKRVRPTLYILKGTDHGSFSDIDSTNVDSDIEKMIVGEEYKIESSTNNRKK